MFVVSCHGPERIKAIHVYVHEHVNDHENDGQSSFSILEGAIGSGTHFRIAKARLIPAVVP